MDQIPFQSEGDPSLGQLSQYDLLVKALQQSKSGGLPGLSSGTGGGTGIGSVPNISNLTSLGGGGDASSGLNGLDWADGANLGGFGALAASYANGSGGSKGAGMSGFGMTGQLPNGMRHGNQALQYPGEAVGAAVGSIWGVPGLGVLAGKNAGFTAGDLIGGNTDALGWDMSSNLPPGMQAPGWGGIANTATGLPLAQWFGIK